MYSLHELNSCKLKNQIIWEPLKPYIFRQENKRHIDLSLEELNKKKLKKCRELLNKLSEENYNTIETELLFLDFDNDYIVDQVVNIFLMKSFEEQLYTNLYVRIIRKLISINESLRNKMINEIQKNFEKVIENKSNLLKIQKLGVIRVVGLLFTNVILPISELEKCILYIEHFIKIDCENLVDYYSLLYTICHDKLNNFPEQKNMIIDNIKKLYDSDHITKKDKFKLLDIIEQNN